LNPRTSTRISRRLNEEKQLAATAALLWVRSGMTLGLGSGSTAALFIKALGTQVRAGDLRIKAVASSRESEAIARAAGISLLAPRRGLRLDLAVDGADQITPGLDLLKGRGGAMLREKIVAQASRYFLVIADSSKRAKRFGKLPVPVEVVPFALPWVADRIAKMGGQPILRMAKAQGRKPYTTDQRNYVLDCRFPSLRNPGQLAERLERIPGVVAHGLFLGCAQAALIAEAGEVRVFRPGRAPVRLQDFSVTL
jgi:ribose 5-phosphate isomerase A